MRWVFAAGLIALLITGSLTGQSPHPQQLTDVGRYQMFFSPHARADVYLVDTITGKIWRPTLINNAHDTNLKSAPEVWIYQERVDTEGAFNGWAATHILPPTSEATK